MSQTNFSPAFDALDSCDAALDELDRLCCEPGRSPRMQALGAKLQDARRELTVLNGGSADPKATLSLLEAAGADVGSLQVGCCAPGRLPLYTEMLEALTTAQLSINRGLGQGH